jgi:hypothetical protein
VLLTGSLGKRSLRVVLLYPPGVEFSLRCGEHVGDIPAEPDVQRMAGFPGPCASR